MYAFSKYISDTLLLICVCLHIAGEGTWTFDTSLPLLQELAKAVGTDLTPDACAARYAESWNASHSNSAEAEE